MSRPGLLRSLLAVILILGLGSTACNDSKRLSETTPTWVQTQVDGTVAQTFISQTPQSTNSTSLIPTVTATVTPTLWLAPYLPDFLRRSISLPRGINPANQPEGANLRLEVGETNTVTRWVFTLVVPFPTIQDGITLEEILHAWDGVPVGPLTGHPLLIDESTLGVFTARWGTPAAGAVKVLPTGQILDTAWGNRPSWAIIPFEQLEPRWKVLEVNGQSPLRKEFNPDDYPLTIPFSLNGEAPMVNITRSLNLKIPSSNRDPARLTTLVLTGTTALVRGTSNMMYAHGVNYPALDIGDWLRDADITHVSNEIPFTPDCPLYTAVQTDLRFCTNPKYIGLLEDIGTKVVELTGDHFADQGPEAMLYTLDLYRKEGWIVYGGGANLQEGRQPAMLEHNGNRFAFIGCNAKGGGYATASATNPGAVSCDYEWMHKEIRRLRDDGYLTIVTFQHQEYYSYNVKPEYRPDFIGMVEAGAVIVSGSQAHQPQNMEFHSGGFIHYGLGNLFFDQVDLYPETRDAFIDRHIFYDGRYIGTELLTMRFIDYARPRPMTSEERAVFLGKIFAASGW